MEPLVYAACALGALMSLDLEVKQTAETFSQSAQKKVIGRLFEPNILLVQTLLCCAHYESGQDNPSKAWALSGTMHNFFISEGS